MWSFDWGRIKKTEFKNGVKIIPDRKLKTNKFRTRNVTNEIKLVGKWSKKYFFGQPDQII